MQKSVWIARPSFPFNASFLFRYYTLHLFFLFFFFLFFVVVVNETIYYNEKKTGNRLQQRQKFLLYVWPIARYIYIKISISTSCSGITIIWYSFYLLTSYFEKLSTWIWRFHLLFAANQLLNLSEYIALALNKIGKLTKSAVYKPLLIR